MSELQSSQDILREYEVEAEKRDATSSITLSGAGNEDAVKRNTKTIEDRSKQSSGFGDGLVAAWQNNTLTAALGEYLGEKEAAGDYDYEAIYSDAPASDGLDVDAYFKKNKEIADRFAALPEEYSARAYEAMNEEHLLQLLTNVEKRQENNETLANMSGASNLAVNLVAGVADPMAILLEAMTAGGATIGAASRLGMAGRTALATGLTTGGSEALIAGQDAMVTNTDIAIATAAGFTLGGAFGAWAGPTRQVDYEEAGSRAVRRAKAEEDPSTPRIQETFVNPIDGDYTLTSKRGSRVHPITGKAHEHGGDDMAAKVGTPIRATASGTVERIDYNTGANGYAVFLRHKDGTQSVYLHMKGQPPLKKGQVVEQGFEIGQVGTTGRSTGPHLHFEIRDADGNKLNPSELIDKHTVEEDLPMDAGPYSVDPDVEDYVAGEDVIAAPTSGTGGLSAAGAESAEYFGGGALSKYILKPAQTFSGILLSDATPSNIRGLAGKLMEGLSRKDGATRGFTAERTAQDLNRRWQSQYVTSTEGHFKEWLKERGGSKLRGAFGNKYLQEFRTEVSAAIRGSADDLSPQARAAADEVRPIFADIVRQAKEAGVEGFEEIAENANYLPRVINNGQMSRIRGAIGDKGIAGLVAGALAAKGMDPKIAKNIGKFYTHSARNRALGGADDIFSDISEESIENLRRSIKGVDEADVDEMINQLKGIKEGAQRQQSKHKNSKFRLDMDENFSTVIDGVRYRVTDLWQNDSYALLSRYSRSLSGWIGLSRHAGIKGDGDWQFQMQRIRDESADSPDLKKQLDNLEHVKTLLTGGSLDPEATSGGAMFLSAVRKANFAAMMGQAGLASFAEFGQLLARHGWVNTMKHVPGFRQLIRGARSAELDEAFTRELHDLTGVGLNTKRGTGTGGYDDLGYMMESKVYNAVDKILDPAARAVGVVGLLGPVNDGLQMVFQKSAASWFGRAARNGGRKGLKPRELKRLRDDGFDDGILDQVLENLNKHADYDGDTITSFNIKDWDGDVAEDFLSGLNRMTYRAVQENDIGSGAYWMHSALGKTVMQFRSFIGNALIKQTIHGAKFNDMQTWTAFTYSMFIAGMTYVGRQTWNNIGDEEKRKERLTPSKIATAAFNNVGYASLIPAAMDTAVGTLTGEQIFSHGRTTGLDSSLITGNPTVDLLTNRLPKIAELSQIPIRGRGVDQQDFNAVRRSAPFNNVLGVTSINSLIEAELPKSTRGDAYWE